MATNQLLCDDLARRCSDAGAFVSLPSGTKPCLLYDIQYRGQRAVLKVQFKPADKDEIGQNLKGYEVMPERIRPAVLTHGVHEGMPFLVMEHAGERLRDLLARPSVDASLAETLEATLHAVYHDSVKRDHEKSVCFFRYLTGRFKKYIDEHLMEKSRIEGLHFDLEEGRRLLCQMEEVSALSIPDCIFWVTTDFSVDNLLYKDGKFLFVDPKFIAPNEVFVDANEVNSNEAVKGLCEVDLGMFLTLMEIYSEVPDGGPPINRANLPVYRDLVHRVVRGVGDECESNSGQGAADSRPFLRLGAAWQHLLSARFRSDGEAEQQYTKALTAMREVFDRLRDT